MALTLPVAYGDPILGGSTFEANTDFKPSQARPNRQEYEEDFPKLPKLAFLSKEELSLDSGYSSSKSASPKTKAHASPRPRSTEMVKPDSPVQMNTDYQMDGLTDGMSTVRLEGETAEELTESEGSSDEYDTDIDDPDYFKQAVDMQTHVGKDTYLWACDDFGAAPMKSVVNNLEKNEINLSGRNMGTKCAMALSVALKKNSRVVNLNLSDNGMGPEGGAHMAAALAENESILNVNLSQNQMGVVGALALGDMIRQNRGIRILNISRNEFNEDAAQYIGHGLELNERLEELDMSYNCICETGGQAIGKALEKNDTLERLNISHNHIRRSGGVAIFKALQGTNFVLSTINISWNGIGYEGALALSEMLKANRYLLEVDIRHCRINWKGALLISHGIKQNASLEVLKMGGNPITTTGTMDLIEATGHQYCAIKHFDISEIMVIYEFEMMAKAIQQTRPDFTYTHGGIVNSHDILGQRLEKRVIPMQRVMDYMKERELRPTELFRSFDKAVKSKLSKDQFAHRIQSSGIPVASWEIDELLETLTGSDADTAINYQNLAGSVGKYIEKERVDRIKEREDAKKLQEYHEKILNPLFNPMLPPIPDEANATDSLGLQLLAAGSGATIAAGLVSASGKGRGLSRVGSLVSLGGSVMSGGAVGGEAVRSQPSLPKPKILSMSTNLGAKAKAFGTVGLKKKKKKVKKKGKKKKK